MMPKTYPAQKPRAQRGHFKYFLDITTRWGDNDLYGHVNNVVYYSYFDTVINRYLIDVGGLDIHSSPIIGITPETSCRFHRSFAYPELVQAGLRVCRLGSTAATYEIGLFGTRENDARAEGRFVHVFVDRETQRPASIPVGIRAALNEILTVTP